MKPSAGVGRSFRTDPLDVRQSHAMVLAVIRNDIRQIHAVEILGFFTLGWHRYGLEDDLGSIWRNVGLTSLDELTAARQGINRTKDGTGRDFHRHFRGGPGRLRRIMQESEGGDGDQFEHGNKPLTDGGKII